MEKYVFNANNREEVTFTKKQINLFPKLRANLKIKPTNGSTIYCQNAIFYGYNGRTVIAVRDFYERYFDDNVDYSCGYNYEDDFIKLIRDLDMPCPPNKNSHIVTHIINYLYQTHMSIDTCDKSCYRSKISRDLYNIIYRIVNPSKNSNSTAKYFAAMKTQFTRGMPMWHYPDGIPFYERVCMFGSIKLMDYESEKLQPFKTQCCNLLAYYGHIDCLRHVHERKGWKLSSNTAFVIPSCSSCSCDGIIFDRREECIEYIRKHIDDYCKYCSCN